MTESLLDATVSSDQLLHTLLTADDYALSIPLKETEPDIVINSNFHFVIYSASARQLRVDFIYCSLMRGPCLERRGETTVIKSTLANTMAHCPAKSIPVDPLSLQIIGIDVSNKFIETAPLLNHSATSQANAV